MRNSIHKLSSRLFLCFCIYSCTLAFSNLAYSAETNKYKIEVWSDNWFSAFLDGEALFEDSISITTERSFNAEIHTFTAANSFLLSFVLKDFKENDTGLEYIGSRRQQMGDGGFIAQVTNLDTNEVVAVSDSEMSCLVVHKAPLDSECANEDKPVAGEGTCQFTASEEPASWNQIKFDDSSWPKATEYTESVVSPKFGYNEINWNSSAKLIWSDDLVKDNTVLCRMKVE